METETKRKAGRPSKAQEIKEATVNTDIWTPTTKYNALEESYKLKCLEYDKLLKAYRNMALRYTEDGKNAKQFIKTALTGIELIFPDDTKLGEN